MTTDPPPFPHVVGVGGGDLGEVDDPGQRRVQAGDPGRVRLDLSHAGGVEAAQLLDAVGEPAALELVERAELALAGGDDQLAGRRASMPRASQYS